MLIADLGLNLKLPFQCPAIGSAHITFLVSSGTTKHLFGVLGTVLKLTFTHKPVDDSLAA